MLRLGLTDARTCIRNAIVGWSDTDTPAVTLRTPPPPANDVLNALLDTVDPAASPDTQDEDDWRYFAREGLLYEGFRPMTHERKQKLTRRFEKGKLKKVIATPVWNVGVNFRQLSVLLRCDAGGPGERNVQVPGRVSRTYGGKEYGTIRDYLDQFDRGYRGNASVRSRDYAGQGFEQRFPPKPRRGSLHRYLFQE